MYVFFFKVLEDIHKSKMPDQDGCHLDIMTALFRNVTSSPDDMDLDEDKSGLNWVHVQNVLFAFGIYDYFHTFRSGNSKGGVKFVVDRHTNEQN